MVASQRQSLLFYLAFKQQKLCGPGSFVVVDGGLADAANAALAASACGAAVLLLYTGMQKARIAMQSGHCDSVVTTLDEAVRILKNQLRCGHSILVILVDEHVTSQRQMQERGIVADVLWSGTTITQSQFAVESSRAESMRARQSHDAELIAKDPSRREWIETVAVRFSRDTERWYSATSMDS